MGGISLQMINNRISSDWWKSLVKHFVRAGDALEIRCWREETEEIRQASAYGTPEEDHYEVSVSGVVSEALIAELLSEAPADKRIYNKMTKYFTVNAEHAKRRFCSAHYGTEMYITGASDDDIAFFRRTMEAYSGEDFSVSIEA